MGDWNDLMDAFGGILPPDIADAQMVPGYARYREPKPPKAGDRIKLLAATIGGWKGYGTALEVEFGMVRFVKDGDDATDWLACQNFCAIEECRPVRRRTPSTKDG